MPYGFAMPCPVFLHMQIYELYDKVQHAFTSFPKVCTAFQQGLTRTGQGWFKKSQNENMKISFKIFAKFFKTSGAKVRENYLHRVDVLEKVKGLLLLPNLEMATTKQVADFYEVNTQTVQNIVDRNRAEIEGDGVVFNSYAEIKEKNKSTHCE